MPRHLLLLWKLFLLGLLTGQLFRLYLFVAHGDQSDGASTSHILRAFFDRGLLFELYVNAWMLLVPTLLLGGRHALVSNSRWPVIAARWIYTLLFIVMLFCACTDLPFYAYTNMRLTDMALSTAQTVQQSLKELVSTPPYFIALLAFIALAWFAVRTISRLFRSLDVTEAPMPARRRWLLFTATLLVLIPGMRGTLDPGDAPLTAEDAYFSETPFLNQLSTNAVYSFLESFGQDKVNYMPAEEAITNVRRYLGIKEQRYASPIARDVTYDAPADPQNVVLILVESLSANRLHRFGHPKNLMPFLEGVMDSSLVFDRFYAAGTRTCNGIFSSLYGLPAIGSQHPLSHPSMVLQDFHGLPGSLRAAGYTTSFLYPGDPLFDNMNGFLPNNGFDTFIAQDDFDASIPRNSWGVTDHALYTKTLEHIGELQRRSDAPFFATVMTISSHKGYNVPDDIAGFAPTSPEGDENIYEYADRALAEFFSAAQKEVWFTNTVFVIVGDHGQRFDPVYEVPLAFHHVPLIIHAPGLVVPRMEHGLGTQVDLPETVLGTLHIPHMNNTLGMDLMRGTHPCAYFCSDHRIAALNRSSYWIRTGETERLYDHPSRSTFNLAGDRRTDLDSLRTYAQSMVQAATWMVEKKLVGISVQKE